MNISRSALIGLGLFILVFLFAFNDYQNSQPRTFTAAIDEYDDSTHVAQRSGINLISGTGITVTSADDPTNSRVNFTFTGTVGSTSTEEDDSEVTATLGTLCWQSAQVGQIRTREDYYYEELRGSSLRVLL